MMRLAGLALGLLVWAMPAMARDVWIVAPPALAEVARALAGPRAQVDSRVEEAAIDAYCAGLGAQTPDALVLTRRLLDRERTRCAAEAIAAEPERVLGLIGLAVEAPLPDLTRRQLWRAVAELLPEASRLRPNPLRNWAEVDPALPDRTIALRLEAPAPLVDALILAPACVGAPGYAKLDRARLCRGVRTDLPTAPDPLVLRMIAPGTAITGMSIEGISPTEDEIASGRYPLARRVYLFLKRPHLAGIPALDALRTTQVPQLLAP
jgi:phosphate transport system substrate-binding protein